LIWKLARAYPPARPTLTKVINSKEYYEFGGTSSTMSLEVQIQEADAYFSIKAVGPYSLVNLYDLFDRVKEESEKRGAQPVILDITEVAGTIPTMDMYMLGVYCYRVLKSSIRIAIIFPDARANNFLENVTRNRGLQVAVVPNHDAATKWVNREQ